MTGPDEKKVIPAAEEATVDGGTPRLSTEDFFKILNLPACKSKGYCDNCGRCER